MLSILGPMCLAVPATGAPPTSGAVKLAWVRSDAAQDCLSANELESELIERMGKNPFEGSPRQWIEGFITRNGERYDVQLFERDAHGKTVGSRKLSETSKSCRVLDEPIVLAIALIIDPNVKLRQRSTAPIAASTPALASTHALAPAPDVAVVPLAQPFTPSPAAAESRTPSAGASTVNATVAGSTTTPPPLPGNAAPLGNAAPSSRNGSALATTNTAPRPVAESSDTSAPRDNRYHNARTQNQTVGVPSNAASALFERGATELQGGTLFVHGLLPRTALGVELGSQTTSGPYALRLSLRWFPEQRTERLGEFGFGATQFGIDACYQVPWQRLRWSNCVEFGAGAIHVTVHQPVPLKPGDRLIASAGANTGLGVALFGPLTLDARLFGAVALNPWEFRLVDSKTNETPSVFRQSSITLGGALALAVRVF